MTSATNSAKGLTREVAELAIPLFSEWLNEIDQALEYDDWPTVSRLAHR